MPGFWRRPVSRMYSYNLDVGEHYYWPMTNYLETSSHEKSSSSTSLARGERAETPGALTFSERLARKWIDGRRFDGARCASASREASVERVTSAVRSSATAASTSRAIRAASEVRHGANEVNSAWLNRGRLREMAGGASARSTSYNELQRQQEQDYQMRLRNRHQQLLQESHLEQEQKIRQQEQLQQLQHQQHMAQSVSRSETTVSQESSTSASHSSTVRMASEKQRVLREQLLQKLQQQQVQQCARQASSQRKQVKVVGEDVEAMRMSHHFQKRQVTDDVAKRIADIRMHPWGDKVELREAEEASMRARARITDLERELDEMTKKAIMSSTLALKSAKQLAYQANLEAEEEALASSTKKSRKVIVESSNLIKA